MEELYSKYFQKSRTFLYPQLGFKKFKTPRVIDTFVSWGELFSVTDRKLICIYEIKNTPDWEYFEKNMLMTHPLMTDSFKIKDDKIIYIFDFDTPDHREDFDRFIEGKYSKLSNKAKKNISNYFGIHTPEWVYVESYIHPHKYYKIYSVILNENEAHLKKCGELCNKYDNLKEDCPHGISEEETSFINSQKDLSYDRSK